MTRLQANLPVSIKHHGSWLKVLLAFPVPVLVPHAVSRHSVARPPGDLVHGRPRSTKERQKEQRPDQSLSVRVNEGWSIHSQWKRIQVRRGERPLAPDSHYQGRYQEHLVQHVASRNQSRQDLGL